MDFTALYTPWRASAEYNAAGNHKHYRIDPGTGALVEASEGETYLESCRMVRVDGFWQVAQDIWCGVQTLGGDLGHHQANTLIL
mgnify:CR=1 FL=1